MFVIRDGERSLKFDGELLAASTSGGIGRTRWVEFSLYRTAGGSYVLSRVGRSLYYHDPSCGVVRRNKITPTPFNEIDESYQPCETCAPHPVSVLDAVCAEQPRYWAQLSDTAEGVVASLMKFDPNGARYLTNVARRLLVDASVKDKSIHDEFMVELID